MGVVGLGVPVVRRYDLLARMVASAEAGTRPPDKYLIVDNGGKLQWGEILGNPTRTVRAIIERPGRNVGVAGAWNLIVAYALGLDGAVGGEFRGYDTTLVIANDDIVLGRETLAELLATHRPGQVTHAPVGDSPFSLFAMDRAVALRVGWFDENFFPAYCEDSDFLWRASLADVPIRQLPMQIEHAHGGSLSCLSPDQQRRFHERLEVVREYYRRKWGGPVGDERFDKPFDGHPPDGWDLRPVTVGGAWPTEPWL